MSDPSEFSTGICLTPPEIDDYDSSVSAFTIFLLILVLVDVSALLVMVFFVWRETNAKKSYQIAKRKAVNLVLSPDYLANLRPPKRPPPVALLATPDELMSKKVSKKSEKGPPKNEGNDENKLLAPSYTAKESSETTGKELEQLAPSYTAMDQVDGKEK